MNVNSAAQLCISFLVNMSGATCEASSMETSSFACWKAIDGNIIPRTNEWATQNDGADGWINITLARRWCITQIILYQRCGTFDQAETLQIDFDVGDTGILVSVHLV